MVHRMSLPTLTLSNTSIFTRTFQVIFSLLQSPHFNISPVFIFFIYIYIYIYLHCYQFSESRACGFHITNTQALHLNALRTTTIHGRIPSTVQSVLNCRLLFQDMSQFPSLLLEETRTVFSEPANSYLHFALTLPNAVSTYVCVTYVAEQREIMGTKTQRIIKNKGK